MVVANASPLIILAKVGLLGTLERLLGPVTIPPPVAAEILQGPPEDPARIALLEGWGLWSPVTEIPEQGRSLGLDAGEAAVLALAVESPPAVALLDDMRARRGAASLGVPVMGSLGVVLRACSVDPGMSAIGSIDALRRAGLYLDEALVEEALRRLNLVPVSNEDGDARAG